MPDKDEQRRYLEGALDGADGAFDKGFFDDHLLAVAHEIEHGVGEAIARLRSKLSLEVVH